MSLFITPRGDTHFSTLWEALGRAFWHRFGARGDLGLKCCAIGRAQSENAILERIREVPRHPLGALPEKRKRPKKRSPRVRPAVVGS